MKKFFTLIATALVAVCANAQVQAIDLGLSVKWGDRYVGATSAETAGNYYAFGETSPKDSYIADNYAYKGESFIDTNSMNECSFNTKDVTVKDAATENCGEGWRMPTLDEMKELIDKCTISIVTPAEMVRGERTILKITGPNGNSFNIVTPGMAGEKGYDDMSSMALYLITSTLMEINTWGGHYAPEYLFIKTWPKSEENPTGKIGSPEYGNFESTYSGYCILPVYADPAAIENVSEDSQVQPAASKYVKAGKLIIEKNGRQYNAVGTQLK